MSGLTTTADPSPGPREQPEPGVARHAGRGALRWWREVLYVLLFYGAYTAVRNTQGSAAVSAREALGNAIEIIRLEQLLGLYHERAIQQAFIEHTGFIEFWNAFYGSFHFVVTVFALVLLFRRFPVRYRAFRNALALTTGLALVGFVLYPLMPPRLLPTPYGFVDTLRLYGSPWSFESAAVAKISNQYAAMPSLHFAWAAWCALALVPALRRPWAKVLAGAYPVATLFAIVVTANHYVLDAVAGLLVLVVGCLGGFALAARTERMRAARARPPSGPARTAAAAA